MNGKVLLWPSATAKACCLSIERAQQGSAGILLIYKFTCFLMHKGWTEHEAGKYLVTLHNLESGCPSSDQGGSVSNIGPHPLSGLPGTAVPHIPPTAQAVGYSGPFPSSFPALRGMKQILEEWRIVRRSCPPQQQEQWQEGRPCGSLWTTHLPLMAQCSPWTTNSTALS